MSSGSHGSSEYRLKRENEASGKSLRERSRTLVDDDDVLGLNGRETKRSSAEAPTSGFGSEIGLADEKISNGPVTTRSSATTASRPMLLLSSLLTGSPL